MTDATASIDTRTSPAARARAALWRRRTDVPVALVVASLACLPSAPWFLPAPQRDSGAFLYVARRMLAGDVPYVDVWDHKGPVLYLVDALALVLGGGSLWGLFALEVAALTIAGVALFRGLSARFGRRAAAVGVAYSAILLPRTLEHGNFTEQWALPLAAIAILAGLRRPGGMTVRGCVVIGACGGAAFLLRQNLVAPYAALAVVALAIPGTDAALGSLRQRLTRLGAMAGGAILVVGSAVSVLAALGALGAWWEATFVYNRVYSGGSVLSKAGAMLSFASGGSLIGPWLVPLVCGYGLALGRIVAQVDAQTRRYRRLSPRHVVPLDWAVFAAVAFPIEIAFASLSGSLYPHYFLAWLPAGAVLATLVGRVVLRSLGGTRLAFWAIALPIAWVAFPSALGWVRAFDADPLTERRAAAAAFVREHTRPDAPVLVWGAEVGVAFEADRRVSGRYPYHYPLLRTGFERRRDLEGWLAELRADPPAVIVDTSSTNRLVPPLDAARRLRFRPQPGYDAADLDDWYTFVTARYRPFATIGRERPWHVWRRVDDAPGTASEREAQGVGSSPDVPPLFSATTEK